VVICKFDVAVSAWKVVINFATVIFVLSSVCADETGLDSSISSAISSLLWIQSVACPLLLYSVNSYTSQYMTLKEHRSNK